jgi:hypothetical protein
MSEQPKWETVNTGKLDATARLEVPGGWLYRTVMVARPDMSVLAMCFVPHPTGRGLT